MKYVDFIGQSVLLTTTLVLAVAFGGSGILIGQFFLGTMQIISSLTSVLTNAPFRKKKIVHLVCSVIYLALIALIFANKIFASSAISVGLMMVPAWILALYYYMITWNWAFSDTNRSKFLPNISF
jgi:hypothetical protein